MNLYLVRGTVEISHFGMHDMHRTNEIRLVKAHTVKEAQEKFAKFWADKTETYSIRVACYDAEALEIIE